MIGETVGGYRIVSTLGRGTTGAVFVGERAGKQVAIKLVEPPLVADRTRADRFLHEVRAAGQVQHTATLRIHDAGVTPDGRVFVIAELLRGETLASALKAGRMSATQIAEIARQAALVLAASHEDGAVHRALDPARIFLVRDSGLAQGTRVKVLGFGAATLVPVASRTYPYRAPEQWLDAASTDPRVDIYALGCIAFEMACGRPPFRGATADEYRAKHTEHPPPAARSLMPDVPPELDALLARALAKDAAKRPRSMRELARGFDVFGGAAAPLAPTNQGTPALAAGIIEARGKLTAPTAADVPRGPPAPNNRSWIPIAIVAAILVLGGGAAIIAALAR